MQGREIVFIACSVSSVPSLIAHKSSNRSQLKPLETAMYCSEYWRWGGRKERGRGREGGERGREGERERGRMGERGEVGGEWGGVHSLFTVKYIN